MDSDISKSSFMLILKNEIWPLHEITEHASPLTAVAKGEVSIDEYRDALKIFYGFILPFEIGIKNFILSPSFDINYGQYYTENNWSRIEYMTQDLLSLGLDAIEIESLRKSENLPEIKNFGNFLGHAYLLEGSRLGGKVISSSLKHHLDLDECTGAAYFSSNGEDINSRWKKYKNIVEIYVKKNDGNEIINSAKECFKSMHDWFLCNK